eukprot:6098013-Pyramimonas_sp.AAC.1
MLRFLHPESVQGTTTGIFQVISKVYQNFLLEGINELKRFSNVSINNNHPALTAIRLLVTECKTRHGDPGFPVWEKPVATPAARGQDDSGAATQDTSIDMTRDP